MPAAGCQGLQAAPLRRRRRGGAAGTPWPCTGRASKAKRHYLSLTEERYHNALEYEILIDTDPTERTITITDKLTGEVIDEWVSSDEPHIIKYLVEGREYVMTEVIAPNGASIIPRGNPHDENTKMQNIMKSRKTVS